MSFPGSCTLERMSLSFDTTGSYEFSSAAEISRIHANPGFGRYFGDHMAVATWTEESGWADDRIVPYGSFMLNPGSAIYHYGQEVFEGLKAYRRADGSVWLFRPEANAARMVSSAKRLALPPLPEEDFLTSIRQLVELDERWVSGAAEQSLYLRPFLIADEDFLGVRPAKTVKYCLITSPVGAYFEGGVKPVDIWVEKQYARVANGGTGSAKCAGNYAASLYPQERAAGFGCSQVLFVDNAEHRWVEELGGMNIFMITKDDELVTPNLNGNILPGVTRDSILKVGPELGLKPVERPIDIAEVLAGIDSGDVRELFACGTAAVITPIGSLTDESGKHVIDTEAATHTMPLRDYLVGVQYGLRDDTFGWTHKVC